MLPFGDDAPEPRLRQRRRAANDTWNHYDRYGVLEYKDRFAKDRLGLTVKGYGTQFVRDFGVAALSVERVLAPRPTTPATPGGLHFSFAGQQIFRFGGTADLDVNLPFNIRLLAGGEFFYEGMRDSNAELRRAVGSRTCCRSSARSTPAAARIPQLPARLRARHRPLRRRRLRRRAVAPVPEADARRRRPYPEGLRRSGLRPRAARLGRHRLQLPARLPRQAQLRDRLPRAGVPEHLDARRAASATAPTRTCRPRRRSRSRASSTRDCLRNVRKVRELELRADYSYTVLSRPHPDPQRRLRQHRQARHPLGRGLRQALPQRRSLPAGVVHLSLLDRPPTPASCARCRTTGSSLGALVQPGQEPARREHEPQRLRRLRRSQPHPDRHRRRRRRRRHRLRRHDDGGDRAT